jgi:hypothetical protein
MRKVEETEWIFHPKAIHYRDFYIDDGAVGQRNLQHAEDCIYKERISLIEFQNRYGNSPVYKNTERVTYSTDIDIRNENDRSID